MSKVKATIAMLLDIEHLYGEHEGRLAPILTTLLLCLVAPLLYVYFGLFVYIPWWLFTPIAIIIAIRIVMIIPGRENFRLANYKKRRDDEWTSTSTLVDISRIHQDGCVEYTRDKIFYAVCCYNGTIENEVERTRELRKFLDALLGDFPFDTYILNVNNTEALRKYYSKTHKFGRNTAGRNFVRIIDNSVEMTENNSMVQCTVYCIKGKRSDWKALRTQIDAAIRSSSARCFKTVYRVEDPEELQTIIDMDADTSVDIEELLRKRYQTGEYGSSRVLAYDPAEEIVIQGKTEHVEKRKQKPVQAVPKSNGFYVKYQDVPKEQEVAREQATAKPDYYKPIVIGGTTGERKSDQKSKSVSTEAKKRSTEKTKGRVNTARGKGRKTKRRIKVK